MRHRGSKVVPGGVVTYVINTCTAVIAVGSANRMILMRCSGMTASPQPFLGVVVGVAGGPATPGRNGAAFNHRAGNQGTNVLRNDFQVRKNAHTCKPRKQHPNAYNACGTGTPSGNGTIHNGKQIAAIERPAKAGL